MARSSPDHPGVSVSAPPNQRWRLRWRERDDADEIRERTWTVLVSGEAEAHRLASTVSQILRDEGSFIPDQSARLHRHSGARLSSVFADWLHWRAEVARKATSTTDYERRATEAFLRAARDQFGAHDVDVSVLDPDVFQQTCNLAFGHLAPATFDLYARRVFAAWSWASDASTPYPGLLPCPRNVTRCLTPCSSVGLAPDAPRWTDLDRCIALMRPWSNTWFIVHILRYTGLRLGQALDLRVRDFDRTTHALWVATGKTAAERAGRRIPVAPPLAELLADVTRGRNENDVIAPVGKICVNAVLRRIFAAGELPEEVWSQVPGRRCMRLSHGFRAAFQAELRRRKVSDPVLDVLVGHLGASVRYRHYVRPSWNELTAAVGLVPRVGYAPKLE